MSLLLEISNLQVEFDTYHGAIRVINDLGFFLNQGETLAIVGESGCGKSMTALTIMGLVPSPPGRIVGGQVQFKGENLLSASSQRMCEIRGNEISMIFQEPMTSLNPVFTIGRQIAETILVHESVTRKKALERTIEVLRAVDIPAPERRLKEYPHQMSGGMRQRVMIAMSLACNPNILIADEPTTALDVTVQAQIFEVLQDLQNRTNAAIILITHDISVVAETANRVFVMYAGCKVEEGSVENILNSPQHPYTKGLISCVPHIQDEPPEERPPLTEIPGSMPALYEIGRGCPFAPRCTMAVDHCLDSMPAHKLIKPGHSVACWLSS